jgi:hypothetical protein
MQKKGIGFPWGEVKGISPKEPKCGIIYSVVKGV